MEDDKTEKIPQSAIDASHNFIAEQLQSLADQLSISIEVLWGIINYKGVAFSPYDELYRHALTQVPADILEKIERIETEAERIITST